MTVAKALNPEDNVLKDALKTQATYETIDLIKYAILCHFELLFQITNSPGKPGKSLNCLDDKLNLGSNFIIIIILLDP